MLVDIVSRNGNLMLNFPLPASGMLDPDELNVLDGITKWMAVNSEGIYATRPWKIYGTGPEEDKSNKEKKAQFNENNRKDLTYERSEEHTSELQSHVNLVCRLLLEKKKKK